MLLSQWLSRFPQSLARPQARRHRRRPQVQVVFRPSDLAKRVDVLEDRTLLATFVVGDGTSLQSALSAANGSPTRDTIILPAGTYSLSGTELQVKQHLNIIGDGADTTIITAGQQSRVLNVFPNVELHVQGVTLTNGVGGGVYNQGRLTLTDSAVTHSGGTGINNVSQLTLMRCTIAHNRGGHAGGLYTSTRSVTVITDSLISGNTSSHHGGGVKAEGPISIHRSAITNNTATTWGGGITVREVFLQLVTISGNSSSSHGGGIAFESPLHSFTFLNAELFDCTIANNIAPYAGALYVVGGVVSVQNTLITGNSSVDSPRVIQISDHPGGLRLRSLGNNITQNNGDLVIFTDGVNGDRVGVDPLIGSLQDNGGPTPTHALLPGSPAIDAGRSIDAITTDQRGIARPQDGNGDGIAAVDIGAYEWIANAPPTLDEIAVPEPITESSGQQTISLTGITGGIGESQVVQIAAASSNQAVILDPVVSYTSPESTGTLTYTPAGVGQSEVTVTVTDGGTDDDLGTTADNVTVTRTFTVSVRDSGILYVGPDDWNDDGLTVLLDGANIRVVVTGSDTDAVLPAALAGVTGIEISGRSDADDVLTVDYSSGNPAPAGGISFDGDTGSDAVSLQNGSVTTTDYTFTDASSGTIDIDGGVVTYTNLGPITDSLNVVDRVFTFGSGSDVVTLIDTATPGIARLSSVSSSEPVEFTAPTGSLTINAGAGNDTVDTSGSDLAVTLDGGDGFDSLTGGPSADVLIGGTRNDTLDAGAGADSVFGGKGFDWLWGGHGNDSLDGEEGDDTIDGESGDDTIVSGAGFDRLIGDSGTDLLVGEFPSAGSIRLSNGILNADDVQDALSGFEQAEITGGDGGVSIDASNFDGPVTLRSGSGPDALSGGPGNDVLDSGDGDDFLFGMAGNDVLHAGAGNDYIDLRGVATEPPPLLTGVTVEAGDGNDTIFGSGIADVIRAGTGDDMVFGGPGNDIIVGDFGNDVLDGGAGNDFLFGSAGRDVLSGGPGDDLLKGQGSSGDALAGGPGIDTLDGGAGTDRIDETFLTTQRVDLTQTELRTDDETDFIRSIENAVIRGGDGGVTIDTRAFTGPVVLYGGAGADYLFSGANNDQLYGFGGNDILDSGAGNDWLLGSAGRDILRGGDGNDVLRGQGANRDRLIGGAGIDRLDGGGGAADILIRDADDIVVEDPSDIVIAELNAAFSVSDDWMDEV